MKIAIASGKGGTGKTTLSCALAFSIQEPVRLLDCDVEEPNSHFFIRPDILRKEAVHSLVPRVDPSKCTGCGECGRVCRFSAIVPLGKTTMVFSELCHSCGGCARICPTGAIMEIPKEIGQIEIGKRRHIEFVSGSLNVGQAMSPPVIREVLRRTGEEKITLIDCPPGTSCPFVTAVRPADVVLLVTEPTPFGLHDLKLAVATLRELGKPFAVVVNRSNGARDRIAEFRGEENFPLVLRIPEDRRVAEAYSRGETLTAVLPELRSKLAALPAKLGALL